MSLHVRAIAHALGIILLLEAVFVVLPLIYSWWQGDGQTTAFALSLLVTAVVGFALWSPNRGKGQPQKRDIYLIVTLGWIMLPLFGALPYLLSGTIPSLVDAFFESVSGFTTTGATIITAIEAQPSSILFWRSLTHWIGGVGIVALMVAIMPILGIGGMQLFSAESSGVMTGKLTPRIKETALIMWVVYVVLTAVTFFLLWLGGLTVFDAINHAMSALSSGGFSTKQASAAAFAPHIQYILAGAMILAGTSFVLMYMVAIGRLRMALKSDELRWYLSVMGLATLAIFLLEAGRGAAALETVFRDSFFQVVSIMTTTGLVTADYTLWTTPSIYILFTLIFIGGMTGSTAGGIKIMRLLILFRDALLEFRKQLYPDAILPVRFNGKVVPQPILYRIIAFVMLYLFIALVSIFILMLAGVDIATSFGATSAMLSSTGPGLGEVGPVGDYAGQSEFVKGYLSALMIVGRLEFFTVLILFTPYFWRKY